MESKDKDTFQGLFGLDSASKEVKFFIWLACLIFATYFAIFGYYRVYMIGNFFIILSIISPIFTAIAISRLAGLSWQYSLLLLIFVPILLILAFFIQIFLFILSGGANA
ncbi:MAG: hypothetical protein KF758_17330 [Anaerolineales bacterium]|nr:hypothetical protein [Anaerolineales bacterium]MBX3038678.1 hypothetical protein [Anaerolineales bacterium]